MGKGQSKTAEVQDAETEQSILLCLGTNYLQPYHMDMAQRLLSSALPSLRFTRQLWTLPIGHSSHNMYLNSLAYGHTSMSYADLYHLTKDIERQLGRTHDDTHTVTIDIDIMLYSGQRYHQADWQHGYVQQLLDEVQQQP